MEAVVVNELLKSFMEAVKYRITEGDRFCWRCWGDNAYTLSSWNGDYDGYSASITFDTDNGVVYELSVCDYAKNRAYRWFNPDHLEAYRTEAGTSRVFNEAWEGVNYTQVDLTSDLLGKMSAIFSGNEYDTRVQVEVELDNDTFNHLAWEAHKRDITINKMIEVIMEEAIRNANS
jgi:hypothetical protein